MTTAILIVVMTLFVITVIHGMMLSELLSRVRKLSSPRPSEELLHHVKDIKRRLKEME